MSKTKNAEQAVIERRLKPLYELIDSGNSKRAIQEADKILKKHPDLICAKALKGLALLRVERNDEAFVLINEIEQLAKKQILDEGTLKALCHCFKEASTPGRIRLLYESQVELKPTEPSLIHLFLANVRLHEYKKQQLIATRLVKEYYNLNFSLWQVASVFMQGIEDPIMGKKMLLPLSKKMLDTLTTTHDQLASAVELYELLYTELEDYDALEKLIDSPSYQKLLELSDEEFFMKKMHCLLRKGQNEEAFIKCLTFLLENEGNVNFSYWNLTYDCLFKFLPTTATNEQKETLESIYLFLEELKQLKPTNQNVQLAQLELFKRIRQNGNDQWKSYIKDEEFRFVENVARYIIMFFIQPSCYNDIRPCLLVMSLKELSSLLYFFTSVDISMVIPQQKHSWKNKSTQDWWGILIGQIVADFSHKEHQEENIQFLINTVQRLLEKGDHFLIDAEATTTMIQIIITMTSRIYADSGDARIFYDLISILEIINQKFNGLASAKLTLACLYKKALYSDRLGELVLDLEIKNVLRDTIGFLFHPVLDYTGQLKAAVRHYSDTGTFFDQAERDAGDSLVLIYRARRFEMLKGIVNMNHRFNRSFVATAADISNRWISALFLLDNISDVMQFFSADKDPIAWDRLVDNRDFTISPLCRNASKFEQERLLLEANQKNFLEMRDFYHIRDELMKTAAILGNPVEWEKASQQLMNVLNLIQKLPATQEVPPDNHDDFSSISSQQFMHSPSFELMTFTLQTLTEALKAEEKECKIDTNRFNKIIQDYANMTVNEANFVMPQQFLAESSFDLQSFTFCKKTLLLYNHGQSLKESNKQGTGILSSTLLEGLLKYQKCAEEKLTHYTQEFDLGKSQTEVSPIWKAAIRDQISETKSEICGKLNIYYKQRLHELKDLFGQSSAKVN